MIYPIQVPAKVYLVPTDKPSNLFTKTHKGVYGDCILPIDRELEYTTNETYIRNIHLINSGNAATNVKDKYFFYNLYIVIDNAIENAQTWHLENNNLNLLKGKKKRTGWEDLKYVIAAVDYDFNNKNKVCPPLVPEEFILKIVESYNNSDMIVDVLVEYENDGIWAFERSSGYAGLRCKVCATWKYKEDELRCDCDRIRVNKKNEIFITQKKHIFEKKDFKDLIKKMWGKDGLNITEITEEDALTFVEKTI